MLLHSGPDGQADNQQAGGGGAVPAELPKVSIVDSRRAQNAEIALKRIKMTLPAISAALDGLKDDVLSSDQLVSLKEFLPSPEEEKKLLAFEQTHKGAAVQLARLGPAEQFMLAMAHCRQARAKLDSMQFKKHFASRVAEWRGTAGLLEKACDDVMLSLKLRKVLDYQQLLL